MSPPADRSSWKKAGGNARPTASPTRRPWQPGKSPAKPTRTPGSGSRGFSRLLGAGLFVALLVTGIVVFIQWWDPPEDPTFVLVGAAPTAALGLPDNAAAANGLSRLRETVGAKELPADEPLTESWKKAIAAAGDGPVVLYFATPGSTDGDRPFVWLAPPGAVPSEEHKVYVDDILGRLSELPDGQPKLLIFDVTHEASSWARGVLRNDFARQLKALDDDIAEIDGLAVICASDAGQLSWISEEWRQPIFTFFFQQGMLGATGGENRVDALMMYEYLRREVRAWVRANRDENQEPILLPAEGGEGRAKAILLATIDHPEDYVFPKGEAPGIDFSVPTELNVEWDRMATLAGQSPPPETTDPLTWREYLDTLMRYEDRLRLGADAADLTARLDALADRMSPSLFETPPKSLANALPIGEALGVTPKPEGEAGFEPLWDAAADGKREVWDRLAEAARDRGRNLAVARLRVGVARELIARLQRDDYRPTPEILRRTVTILDWIDETDVGPAETHLIRMTERHLSRDPSPDLALTANALGLRSRAEGVAWMSGSSHPDEVFRWVRSKIDEADARRRLGEDLLFAADDGSWDRAKGYLKDAGDLYTVADEQIAIVSDALAVRDRVLGRLPYYARWAAVVGREEARTDVDRRLESIERLAGLAHDLARKTESPSPDTQELSDLTKRVRGQFGDLEKAHRAEIPDIDNARSGSITRANWHKLRGILRVPFVEGRGRLMRDLARTSETLLAEHDTQERDAQSEGDVGEDPVDYAKRQGRMSLAVMGSVWANGPANGGRRSWAELRDDILRASGADPWPDLNRAGVEIGQLWRGLPAAVGQAMGQAGRGTLDEGSPYLAEAARLTRLVDPATPLPRDIDPPREERRYRTHELLLWHAGRAVADGWASAEPRPGEDAYCVKAARHYADDAATLMTPPDRNPSPDEKQRLTEHVAEVTKAIRPPEVTLNVKDSQELPPNTSAWDLEYRVTAKGRVGIPMLRFNLPEGLRFDDRTQPPRLPLDLDGIADQELSRTVAFAFTTPEPNGQPGPVAADVYYRGHVVKRQTRPELLNDPDLIWKYEPPTGTARFGVVAEPDVIDAGVVLLIDNTLSMDDPLRGGAVGGSKLSNTFQALRQLLNTTDIPEDTRLSIWAFHGLEDGTPIIEEVVKEYRWSRTIDKDSVQKVIDAVRQKIDTPAEARSTPLGQIIASVVRNRTGFPKDFTGVRTIVVLSDGFDNIDGFKDRKPLPDPGEMVVEAMNKSFHDVSVNLVLFGLGKVKLDGVEVSEAEIARTQFGNIEKETAFPERPETRGYITTADNLNELVAQLRDVMTPRVTVLDKNKKRPVGLPRGQKMTLFEGGLDFTEALPPGSYDLLFRGQRVTLELLPGDKPVLRWGRDAGGDFAMRLPTYTDIRQLPSTFQRSRIKAGVSGDGLFRMTVPSCKVSNRIPETLRMIVTLEQPLTAGQIDLNQQRPKFVWLEPRPIDPENPDARMRIRIVNVTDPRIAPAWELHAWRWASLRGRTNPSDNPAHVELKGYWVGSFPGESNGFTVADPRNPAGERAEINRTLSVGDAQVSIEALSLETEAGGQYLTFLIRHEPGDPVLLWSSLSDGGKGQLPVGSEHQYFHERNLYRARIGPLSGDDLDRALSFKLYSIDRIKRVGSEIIVQIDPATSGPVNLLETLGSGTK